jgi:hypothetical protein
MATANGDDESRDPTRLRNQPSLTSSSGTIWLVVGGVFSAIALAFLIPMTQLPPPGVALATACLVVLLYVGMVLVRVLVFPGRRRLGMLAVGMLGIAAVALTGMLIVAGTEWSLAL